MGHKEWKTEEMKKAYGKRMVVTPFGVVEDSKMSGEEPPLEVHYTQDKTLSKNL